MPYPNDNTVTITVVYPQGCNTYENCYDMNYTARGFKFFYRDSDNRPVRVTTTCQYIITHVNPLTPCSPSNGF